jgi:hypothetical protein
MHRSVFLYIPLFCLLALSINCPFVLSAEAQTCGGAGVAVQVLAPEGRSCRTNVLPAAIWCGKTDRCGC